MLSVEEFVEHYNVDCELKVVPTMDVIMGEDFERYVDKSFADAKKEGVNVDWVTRLGQEEAREVGPHQDSLGVSGLHIQAITMSGSTRSLHMARCFTSLAEIGSGHPSHQLGARWL